MYMQSALSTEYIRVPVFATDGSSEIVPTSDVVEMAFVPPGTSPAELDWESATWETDTNTTPVTYYARCLVGPDGGVVTLTESLYDVFVRVGDNPETVVHRTGAIAIF